MSAVTRTLNAPQSKHACLAGKWRLTQLIGAGRATQVFRARPMDRGEDWPADYVVKTAVLNGPRELSEVLLRNEAAACDAACSPHLPAVLEASWSETPYLVFAYLAGGSVEQRLQRWGRPPATHAYWILRQILDGLASLHRAGWTHGDIKPANVMVAADGHATLIDLGFADRRRRGERRPLMSTPAFAAPELHQQGESTPASDLYSVGVTAFRMLTGRLPFERDNAEQLAEAHRSDPPPDVRTLTPNLSFESARLIRRLLSKDPAARPTLPQAREQVTALEIDSFAQRSTLDPTEARSGLAALHGERLATVAQVQ